MDLSGFQVAHLNNGGILREKRVSLGLTQQQVADKAKIKLQQYQKLESGERDIKNCSYDLACRVIEALGMNVADFFHGEYVFGEAVTLSEDGFRYKRTGKLMSESDDE